MAISRRRKIVSAILSVAITGTMLTGFSASVSADAIAADIGVAYQVYGQTYGWTQGIKADGATAGTTGKSTIIEAVKINLTGTALPAGASITYQAHVQHLGWLPSVSNGAIAGKTDQSLRLEAVRMTLAGMSGYEVKYRAYVKSEGWLAWQTTVNGTDIAHAGVAGTTGQYRRAEAVEVELVKAADSTSSASSATVSAFSCIVSESGKVYWDAGVDSFDQLISKFSLKDDESYAKVEMVPDNKEVYPYLYPDEPWKMVIDETATPSWFTQSDKDAVTKAFEEWKAAIYQFDYKSARNPFDPTTISTHAPTEKDIALLKEWIAVYGSCSTFVRNSVRDTVTSAVGVSVGNCVWNYLNDSFWAKVMDKTNIAAVVKAASGNTNVGSKQADYIAALVGSYFPNIADWKYYLGGTGKYPYQSAVDLLKDGFIVSYDLHTWRLHSAADGSIVYSLPDSDVETNNAFSCVVSESGKVYWKAGVDSCSELMDTFNLQDDGTSYVKVEMVPDNKEAYPYLYPDEPWKMVIDETVTPSWFAQSDKDAVASAFDEWKKTAYQFDIAKILEPFDTATSQQVKTPTAADIANLKEWATVWESVKAQNTSIGPSVIAAGWASVGPCIWNNADLAFVGAYRVLHLFQGQPACPGPNICEAIANSIGRPLDSAAQDCIGDSISDSQEAYIGSCFTNVTDWNYKGGLEITGYPYQSAAELWKRDLIPTFDGTTWRLSSGPDSAVVYAISEKKLLSES